MNIITKVIKETTTKYVETHLTIGNLLNASSYDTKFCIFYDDYTQITGTEHEIRDILEKQGDLEWLDETFQWFEHSWMENDKTIFIMGNEMECK